MATQRPVTLRELLITDLWNEPLCTMSRTRDRLGHIDFAMVIPPLRAFIYYMLCPFLCYPIAALHLWGYYRCLRTLVLPKSYRRERYASHVMYGVQKRMYDPGQKRLHEVPVNDVQEIQHALEVTQGERNHFVDDPAAKGVAYFVVEQKIMRAEAVFTGENWAWAFISDSCRFLTPVVLAYMFVPSCKRLRTDLQLWAQGRLRWRQLRHPILNFFKSYREYNSAIRRINITKPSPKGDRDSGMQGSETWAADEFVASLMAMRGEEEQRRVARRRRRVDYIAMSNKERLRNSRERLSKIIRRHCDTMSLIERDLRNSLGNMGSWWDLVSTHILEEERECREAVMMQKQLNSMYLSTTMKREVAEQSSVVSNDERRFRELLEFCISEDRRARVEAVGQAVETILTTVDVSIDFLERHTLLDRFRGSLLARTALDSFIRKTNRTPLTNSDLAGIAFSTIFGCHPFHMTDGTFVQLVHTMYAKLNPGPPTISCFDVCRIPLFLVTGPKLSGKTLVSRQVADQLSLIHLSDLDLVNRAIEAYRAERNVLPTLRTVEDSAALPVLSAYEERDEQDEEVVYQSDSRIVQTVESVVRLSPWAVIGKTIEEDLLRGDYVSPSKVVELMQLQMAAPPEGCCGILFDGSVAGVGELEALQRVIPHSEHPFEGAMRRWPSPSLPLPPTEVVQSREDQEEGVPAAEPLDNLLLVRREVQPDRPVAKGDGRTRPPKKGVDLNALPPPVLPEVIRPELTPEDTDAIEQWEQRRHTHPLFSAVVRIHCGAWEIFRRFAGLRIDKETSDQYHMVFHPPPPERAPHVVNVDRTKTTAAQLHRIILKQEEDWSEMRRWLLQREGGNEIMHEVEGEQVVEGIVADVERTLRAAQDEFSAGIQIYHAAMAAKERKRRIEESIAEQEAVREAERRRIIAVYTECGVAIPPPLESRPPLPPFYSMPDDLPEAFMRALTAFMKRYEDGYCWMGIAMETLVGVMLEHRYVAMDVFDRFWKQTDERREKIDRFIENYNRLPIALLGHVACKEELHLLVDHLKEELFHIVEVTGKEGSAKLDQITKKENFLGPWCTLVYNIGITAVQAEMERFLTTMNLVAMYFGALVNLPSMLEELDSESIIVRSVAEMAQEQARGKEKKAQSTKKNLRIEDVVEKTIEDVFADVIGKLVASLTGYVEKFSSIIAASAKVRESGRAAAMLADDGRAALILSRCLPFAHGELASSQKRIACIRKVFSQLMHEGETYCAAIRDDMLTSMRTKQLNQAAAVNTAIYIIRNAIEEERPLPSMHLGRETFYVVPEKPDAVPMQGPTTCHRLSSLIPEEEPRIHATLSASRLVEIVEAFRAVAPGYALDYDVFCYILRSADYAGAAATTAANFARLKTREEVFRSFDPHVCGLIDWRELVLHLLLWCAPVPETTTVPAENFFIDECSVTQLIETRVEMGLHMLNEESFYGIPFFFSRCLSPERLKAYMRVLWMTFSGEDGLLDPLPLLAMLCSDQQPVRGVQKLFYMLSLAKNGALMPEEMDLAFHVHVTNPRNMCMPDAFSRENIAALYDGAPSLSFQSVCERAMGRSMLNSTKVFRRKSFVTDAPDVE